MNDIPATPPEPLANAVMPPPVPTARPARGSPAPAHPFGDHYGPMPARPGPFNVVDTLLKRPGHLTYEITRGSLARVSGILASILLVCMLAYGFIIALFPGGQQLWLVPLKVAGGTALTALICLPSLYIFVCLSGGQQTMPQTAGLLLQALALSGILLVGFAPIAWVFSQSTQAAAFMGGLHLAFWLTAAGFSLRLLGTALAFLNQGRARFLGLWGFIFILVAMQMTTTLRPLVGPAEGSGFQGKKFFLAHWAECLR